MITITLQKPKSLLAAEQDYGSVQLAVMPRIGEAINLGDQWGMVTVTAIIHTPAVGGVAAQVLVLV
jgi:hypothetical protein